MSALTGRSILIVSSTGIGASLGLLVGIWLGRRHRHRPSAPAEIRAANRHKLRGMTNLVASYPSSHWCRTVMSPSDPRFVAVLRVYGRDVLVFLRGSGHAGGFAAVAALTDRSDPTRVLNRVPSQADFEAVTLTAAQVAGAFLSLGIFPQMELLGNNSHGFDREMGALTLGTEEEPFVPHVHVTGRGDPVHEYVQGVPLRGLTPGQVMVPRRRKQEWDDELEISKVSAALAAALLALDVHPDVRVSECRNGC